MCVRLFSSWFMLGPILLVISFYLSAVYVTQVLYTHWSDSKARLNTSFCPWSSLVEGDEGCIGPSSKLLCLWQTRKYAAHACQHSIHSNNVRLLGQSGCSSPSTKELHVEAITRSATSGSSSLSLYTFDGSKPSSGSNWTPIAIVIEISNFST